MNIIKTYNNGVRIALVLLFTAVAGMIIFSGAAQADLSIKANHDHIKIDFFYHGSTVSVRGEADPGTDLIVKVTSPEGHQKLKKKGKAAGFLWMNVGDLEINNVPNLYFLHSTKNIEDILSPDERAKHLIGYPSIKEHAAISPVENAADRDHWFQEFIKFKESSKLYTTSSGKIELGEREGRQDYYILCDWPYQAAPGDYLVTVYAVKGDKVVDKAEAQVLVEQVGVVKTLFHMANKNGALYGGISILAALGAGFGVGMIFRKGGGGH